MYVRTRARTHTHTHTYTHTCITQTYTHIQTLYREIIDTNRTLLHTDILKQRREGLTDNISGRRSKRKKLAELMDGNRTAVVSDNTANVTAGMDDVSSQFEQLYSCSSSSEDDDDDDDNDDDEER